MRNGLFVADDYRGLHRQNVTGDDMYALMEFRAEYGIDIIMVCHGPSAILEGLGMYISHFYIFYTMGRDEKWDGKVDIAEHCTRANDLIKEYVKYLRDYKKIDIIKNPEICYNNVTFEHTFPHIIVERHTGNLIPQHIDNEWLQDNKHRFVLDM